jgi:glycosyltransferase involved in cell wall biosynthesis
MGVPDDAPLVVMAGQSVPRKGHAILLEALASMTAARPDLHAWLICSEHDGDAAAHTRQLRERAAALGCGRSIRITEGVGRIASALRAADVVAVPSLREPFGRIAVEAMLAERPVVASAVDGLKEIVEDEETGLLVPPGHPILLAAALDRVLREREVWRMRGRAARRRALQLFSVERVAGEVAALYGSLARP